MAWGCVWWVERIRAHLDVVLWLGTGMRAGFEAKEKQRSEKMLGCSGCSKQTAWLRKIPNYDTGTILSILGLSGWKTTELSFRDKGIHKSLGEDIPVVAQASWYQQPCDNLFEHDTHPAQHLDSLPQAVNLILINSLLCICTSACAVLLCVWNC